VDRLWRIDPEHRLERIDLVDRVHRIHPVDRISGVDLVDRIRGIGPVDQLGLLAGLSALVRQRRLGAVSCVELVRPLLAVPATASA